MVNAKDLWCSYYIREYSSTFKDDVNGADKVVLGIHPCIVINMYHHSKHSRSKSNGDQLRAILTLRYCNACGQ
jgi:hypothetical protein